MKLLRILSIGLLALTASIQTSSAKIFDGVDSENLGKGDWIYYVSMATNHLGGHVSSVTSVNTLMDYYVSQGLKWFVVKAGTGSTNFNGSGSTPQFTSSLVTAAHNKGLKIFAYTRSYGDNIQGEINLATRCFNLGADGFILDAESEWESGHQGTQGPTKATQLCSGIKAAWPTKWLGHAPFPYISLHSSFPYKEFGYYCDTVMPQDYWYSIGVTPATMVDDMDREWRNWQASLTGQWTNSIKPIAPIAQADTTAIPGSDITAFFNALNSDTAPATTGGYRGISFWRADLHTTSQWSAIKAGVLNPVQPPPDNSIIVDNPAATVVGTWSTGTSSTDKYGSDYRFKNGGSGSSYLKFTPNITTAGDYAIYEWHPQGGNRSTGAPYVVAYNGGTATIAVNQQINGGQWNLLGTFNLVNGTTGNVKLTDGFADSANVAIADAIKFTPIASDIIVDNPSATVVGSWTIASSATDKFGSDYRYAGPGSGSAYLQYAPNLTTAGNYQIYEWHSAGANRTTDAPYVVTSTSGSQTIRVNQQVNGGQWNLIGTFSFNTGTAGRVQIKDNFTTGSVVIADAVKFVFTP